MIVIKILTYMGQRDLRVSDADDPGPVLDNEVKLRSLFSGVSHGTEMNVYRGDAPFYRKKLDHATGLFVEAGGEELWRYPIRSCDPGVWYMGYCNVGEVVELGNAVKNLMVGDIVITNAPHQSLAVKLEWECVKLPDGLDPLYGIFFTNLMTAFNGILDANIKLGDTVIICGLGVMGQILVQMARMSGARKIIGVDKLHKRLDIALANGEDLIINTGETDDAALAARRLNDNRPADVVVEASGNQSLLNQAIRMAGYEGVVTALGWYQGNCAALDLSEEFHHQRVTIRCSQTGGIDQSITNKWDYNRKVDTCKWLLMKLKFNDLVTHIMPYDQAPEGYHMIDRQDESIIQVAFKY